MDWCPHHTHTFGAKGLFDGVKGSPSIRQCVLILALGRFPIDYFTSEIHSTSLNRPTHILPNRSQGSAYLAFWVWLRLQQLHLLKTHKYFQSKAREQIASCSDQGDHDSFCHIRYRGMGVEAARSPVFPHAFMKSNSSLLISSSVRSTRCWGIKQPDISPTDLITTWTARLALSCLWRGGRIREKKCQG